MSDGARRCLQKYIKRGVPPRHHLWYNTIIEAIVKGKTGMDFFDPSVKVCRSYKSDIKTKKLCLLPPQKDDISYEIGYDVDGYHLSYAGSYFLRHFLDDFFAPKLEYGT